MARLHHYNKTFNTDPVLLRVPCPQTGFRRTVVAANNTTTPATFDNADYQNLEKGPGLHRDSICGHGGLEATSR